MYYFNKGPLRALTPPPSEQVSTLGILTHSTHDIDLFPALLLIVALTTLHHKIHTPKPTVRGVLNCNLISNCLFLTIIPNGRAAKPLSTLSQDYGFLKPAVLAYVSPATGAILISGWRLRDLWVRNDGNTPARHSLSGEVAPSNRQSAQVCPCNPMYLHPLSLRTRLRRTRTCRRLEQVEPRTDGERRIPVSGSWEMFSLSPSSWPVILQHFTAAFVMLCLSDVNVATSAHFAAPCSHLVFCYILLWLGVFLCLFLCSLGCLCIYYHYIRLIFNTCTSNCGCGIYTAPLSQFDSKNIKN